MLASDALIVDACRNAIRQSGASTSLATRPVLFALARALGEAWPGDVARDVLLARAFGAKYVDESHRARLRVEIGRLRAALRDIADIRATKRGFALVPHRARTGAGAGAARRGGACVGARAARRRRGVVHVGARARARRESAHGAARARIARARGEGAAVRPRTRASMDHAATLGIHDSFVTPGRAADRVTSASCANPMPRSFASTARFRGRKNIGGVTYDGRSVWFADGEKLRSFDPATGDESRTRSTCPRTPAPHSTANSCIRSATARSRKSILQTRRVVSTIPAPGEGVLPDWRGPKERCGSGSTAAARSIR